MCAALSPKQLLVFEFIQQFQGEKGYAPSLQEIARHFGFSSLGTVQNYLIRLEREGLVRKKKWNAKRSLKLVENSDRHPPSVIGSASGANGNEVSLPLVGQVAAGRPIEAVATDETVDVPRSLLGSRRVLKGAPDPSARPGGDHFVLRVTGSSMIEDGILDGDLVVIRKSSVARDGQTVVALLDNEATIKKYYRKGSRVELHPANPAFKPLIIDSMVETRDFKIEGVLVGLIRRVE